MVATPPQTDTYNTALDVFDRTHPLRVDVDENLKVTLAGSGSVTIGTVNQGTGGASPWLVNVNNFPATQPVSIAGTINVAGTISALQSGTWTTGRTWTLSSSTDSVNTTRVGGTMNTGQVSIASTSTLILAANSNRKRLVLINMGTTNVFVGNIGVTIGTGQLLLGIAGYVIPLYFTGAVYGIVGTGTQTIAYLEEAV